MRIKILSTCLITGLQDPVPKGEIVEVGKEEGEALETVGVAKKTTSDATWPDPKRTKTWNGPQKPIVADPSGIHPDDIAAEKAEAAKAEAAKAEAEAEAAKAEAEAAKAEAVIDSAKTLSPVKK